MMLSVLTVFCGLSSNSLAMSQLLFDRPMNLTKSICEMSAETILLISEFAADSMACKLL
jgi:hypothetical protein